MSMRTHAHVHARIDMCMRMHPSKESFMSACVVHAAASRLELQLFVYASTAIYLNPRLISTELKRLGLSWKRMKYWSSRRDEQSRANFWTNGPFAGVNGVVPGVHGERGVAHREAGPVSQGEVSGPLIRPTKSNADKLSLRRW